MEETLTAGWELESSLLSRVILLGAGGRDVEGSSCPSLDRVRVIFVLKVPLLSVILCLHCTFDPR